MNDYTTTVTVAGPPATTFAAILDVPGWWNEAIDGPTTQVGDEFGFQVENLHRIRVRVTDVTPDRRVEWLVVENHFAFVTDQSEWVGDRIVFELEPVAEGTEVTFTQHGLVPGLECYDVCSNAWAFFVGDSLRSLAEYGTGKPESSAGTAAPADRARDAVDALNQDHDT